MESNTADDSRWPQLARASLLSAVLSKHVQYVGFADRRAQGMITISALLIPIAFTGIQHPFYRLGATIAIVTSVLTICCAVLSLYPKRASHKGHEDMNLFHFSQIQNFSEEEYLQKMKETLEDTGELAKMAVMDLYHMANNILRPKLFWLRACSFVVLVGNIIALLSIASGISS